MSDHAQVDYASITINDKNPLKRFLQNKRLNHALRYFNPDRAVKVLDYGTGDGELSLRIDGKAGNVRIYSYEPSPNLRKQAERKLADKTNITVLSATQELTDSSLDYIFCLEVFEHLTPEIIRGEFKEFQRLLRKDGRIIIGVPNEIYLAAFFKGALRLKRRHGDSDAVPVNIIKAGLGFPPEKREVVDFDGLPYILRHMGFDYRKFKSLLTDYFDIEKVYGSPFPRAPVLFNLEIYFICRAKR